MAVSNVLVTYRNPNFATNANVNYLRGHVGDNLEIKITFETVASFAEIAFYSNFVKNSETTYPTSGAYTIPDSLFKSLSTNEVQSWRGVVGVLNPNNLKSWQEGDVTLVYVGAGGAGHQWRLDITTKLTPYILQSHLLFSGIPNVSQVDYLQGIESLKHIFKFECFTTLGDVVPADSSELTDLSSVLLNGSVGFYDEFLNGNAPNHEKESLTRTGQTFTGRIKNNVGAWAVTDKLILKSIRVPDAFDTAFTLDENHYYNELEALADGANVTDSLVTAYTATINGTDTTICDIVFTLDRRFYENRGDYILVLTCGTPSTNEADNKRTTVFLKPVNDVYAIDENLLSLGTIGLPFEQAVFQYHNDTDISESSDNIHGYVEDIITMYAKIRIPRGVSDRDFITLNNLQIKFKSDENSNLELRNFTAEDNTNQSYNRSYQLLATDYRNSITFENTLIEAANNDGALYASSLTTLTRVDSGSFITDGYVVGASLAITGDITHNSIIASVEALVITLVTPLDIQYLGAYWDVTFDAAINYFNTARTTLAYKEYNIKYPFTLRYEPLIGQDWSAQTNLELILTATITQSYANKFDSSSIQQDFTYTVDDFTVLDYDENNANDPTITGDNV
jgi:hypothetical protein